MYEQLLQMSGEKCFTLAQDRPAEMQVDNQGVTIIYPTGNKLFIPRHMVEIAINELKRKGCLTAEEVHEITEFTGPRTDRLLAILRALPDVRHEKQPRVLYLSTHQMP